MIAALTLALLLQDDATEQLVKAGKAAGEWASYGYRCESTIDATFFGGTVRPKGAFEKGKAFQMKLDDTEVLRANGKTVVKNPGDEWAPPKDERGPRTLKGMAIKNFPPPHELMARMEAKFFKGVQAEGATDFINGVECVVFKAELTEEGVKTMSGLPSEMAGMARECTGTLRVWVDDAFTIQRYKLDGKATVTEMAVGLKAEIEFQDVGKAKVELPDPAKKALQ